MLPLFFVKNEKKWAKVGASQGLSKQKMMDIEDIFDAKRATRTHSFIERDMFAHASKGKKEVRGPAMPSHARSNSTGAANLEIDQYVSLIGTLPSSQLIHGNLL